MRRCCLPSAPRRRSLSAARIIVIPGRPDVPIFENGVDVSWSVVEGEYGLDRPNIVNPVVIYRMPPVVVPYPGRAALGPAYFPRDGMTPGYGRLEIVPPPNRPLPRPAQSYSRSWRMESAPTPADLPSNKSEHHRAGDHALCLPRCGPARSVWASQMIASRKIGAAGLVPVNVASPDGGNCREVRSIISFHRTNSGGVHRGARHRVRLCGFRPMLRRGSHCAGCCAGCRGPRSHPAGHGCSAGDWDTNGWGCGGCGGCGGSGGAGRGGPDRGR